MVAAPPVLAQRSSLAERVAALEHAASSSASEPGANLELINQLNQLRDDLRDLRSEIERLQQNYQQVQAVARSQYLDLDDRLEQLERASAPGSVTGREDGDAQEADTAALDPIHKGSAAAPAVAAADSSAAVDDAAEIAVTDAADDAAPPADERSRYEAAFDALRAGRYKESAQLFSAFLRVFPDGNFAPNARYWLGESYYVTEDYARAEVQFRALIARWPDNDKAPGALLKVGLSQYGQNHYDAAEDTLAEVEERYPGTDAAKTAADRLRAIQVSRLN